MSPDRYRSEPPLGRAQLVIGLYGALALLAILVSAGRGDPDPYRLDDSVSWGMLAISPLIGLAIAALIVWLTRIVTARFAWAKTLHRDFRELLGPLTTREIIILAAASSIGEELLFRGTLLPWIGVWPQAVIFAFLHVGPGRRFLPWTASALVLGVGLGYVANVTDNLGAPIVAHFTINLLNLRYIVRVDLNPVDDRPALIPPGAEIEKLDLQPKKK
jgi:membrane protease YdiL (CAAX protease family)